MNASETKSSKSKSGKSSKSQKQAQKVLSGVSKGEPLPTVVFESLKKIFGKQESLVGRLQIQAPIGTAQGGKKELMGKRGLMCALCLDVSGSMDAPASIPDGAGLGTQFAVHMSSPGMGMRTPMRTRLQECQRAIESLLPQLDENDYLSLTVFSSSAQTVFSSSPMNANNKEQFLKVLSTLVASGSTALFEGWQMAAASACEGLKMDLLSRVIVLTDGEATTEKSPQKIADAVKKLAQLDVSTSCFGVGAQFNEDLLTHMSVQGRGNFRYIPDAQMAQKAAYDEVMGLSALRGKNVRIHLSSSSDQILSMNIEGLKEQSPGVYECANLIEGKHQQYALVVKMHTDSTLTQVPIEVRVKFQTLQGMDLEQSYTVTFERTLDQERVQAPEDQEVQGLWVSAQAAQSKMQLAQAVSMGQWDVANSLLSQTQQLVGSMSSQSSYAVGETADLERLALAVQSKDTQRARKEALFQSYSRVANQTVRMDDPNESI